LDVGRQKTTRSALPPFLNPTVMKILFDGDNLFFCGFKKIVVNGGAKLAKRYHLCFYNQQSTYEVGLYRLIT